MKQIRKEEENLDKYTTPIMRENLLQAKKIKERENAVDQGEKKHTLET